MTPGPLAAEVRLGPAGWALTRWSLVQVGLALATLVLASSAPAWLPEGVQSPHRLALQMLLFGLGGLSLFVALDAVRGRGVDPWAFGLQWPARSGWRRLVVAVVAATAVHALIVAAGERLSPALAAYSAKPLEGIDLGQGPWAQALLVLTVTVIGPLGEEIAFRGLLFGSLAAALGRSAWLQRRLGGARWVRWAVVLAALAASAAFADIHAADGVPAAAWPVYLALGLTYQAAYVLSGSLWAPVLVHSIHNAWTLHPALLGPTEASAVPLQPDLLRALCIAAPFLSMLALAALSAGLTAASRGGPVTTAAADARA